MALKQWNELSVELRRSPRKRWDYLVKELGGKSSSSDDKTQSDDE